MPMLMPQMTGLKRTLLHAALFKQKPAVFLSPYSNLADFKKNPAFQADALAIRKTLIELVSNTRKDPWHALKSLFGIMPIKNELFGFREVLLPQEQLDYLKSLDETCHQLILTEHLPLLKTFYLAKKSEQSLLGAFYRQITFEQMIHRFIQARYTAAYQDGRLLEYREGHQRQQEPLAHLSGKEKLLAVGTAADRGELYKEYLTIEESALSHLVSATGYFLAISNGIRPTTSSTAINDTRKQLEEAHIGPTLISYAVGPEFRNGLTAHYDALMCIEYENEKPGHPQYERRQTALTQKGFASVAEALYGVEFPQGPTLRKHCERVPFPVSEPIFQSETAYFYVNAYKHRLKHTLKQILIANELFMPEPGTLRLKGLSLGAFGIHGLECLLEKLYLDVLKELLQIMPLKKVTRIDLLNFPSMMTRYNLHSGDVDYYMNYTSGIRRPELASLDSPIPVAHLLAPCLSQAEDRYMATQICGDSISTAGNEAKIGLPPRSSDEATMFYALAGIPSMCQAEKMTFEALAKKIIITDGKTCHTLAGEDKRVDLSCVEYGHIKEPLSLETKAIPLEDAIQTMDQLNAIPGVAAALELTPQEGHWKTAVTIRPDYHRMRFFNLITPPYSERNQPNDSNRTRKPSSP